MSRSQRVKPTAVAESLADYFLEVTTEKWERGPSPQETNLERYRGILGYSEDRKPIRTPESLAEGCLAFMREVTHFEPKPYQEEIVRRLLKRKRLAVRAPRKAGKSAVSANLILWFAAVHDICKVPTTAGAWAQLEEFLWPEIHLWHSKADWGLIGRKPKMNVLDFSFGGSEDDNIKPTASAFAIRSDEPEKMEGAHSPNVLLLMDEAKVIEDATFDAVEGTLSGASKYALVVSTPGPQTGRFYELHTETEKFSDWDRMHITYEMVRDGFADEEDRQAHIKWAEDRKRQWGSDSAMYRNHVLAEFADTGDECIIPLEWVEAAMERHDAWKAAGYPQDWLIEPEKRSVGADIAGKGKDKTVLAPREGNAIRELKKRHRTSTMDTANTLMDDFASQYPSLNIESDGMGVGVYDRCVEIKANAESGTPQRNVRITSVISGSKTDEKDKSGELGFRDKRSLMWWRMREMLDPESGMDLMLPNDKDLKKELITPKWELQPGGIIKVEKKEEIRKRLKGKSTDNADAVIIAFSESSTVIVVETVRVSPEVKQAPNSGRGRVGGTIYDPRQSRWLRSLWRR